MEWSGVECDSKWGWRFRFAGFFRPRLSDFLVLSKSGTSSSMNSCFVRWIVGVSLTARTNRNPKFLFVLRRSYSLNKVWWSLPPQTTHWLGYLVTLEKKKTKLCNVQTAEIWLIMQLEMKGKEEYYLWLFAQLGTQTRPTKQHKKNLSHERKSVMSFMGWETIRRIY